MRGLIIIATKFTKMLMLKQKNLAETIDNNDYTRRNRFTGESIELTKEEADKHDRIFYLSKSYVAIKSYILH